MTVQGGLRHCVTVKHIFTEATFSLVNFAHAGDMAYLAQASENAKRKDGVGGTWAQDYYLPAKADG